MCSPRSCEPCLARFLKRHFHCRETVHNTMLAASKELHSHRCHTAHVGLILVSLCLPALTCPPHKGKWHCLLVMCSADHLVTGFWTFYCFGPSKSKLEISREPLWLTLVRHRMCNFPIVILFVYIWLHGNVSKLFDWEVRRWYNLRWLYPQFWVGLSEPSFSPCLLVPGKWPWAKCKQNKRTYTGF